MIIKEAKVGKFGKLENVQYQFSPRINVIYGPNESGKSTLMQFLKAMLFGLEKTRVRKTLDTYNKYEPWDTPAYFFGSMIFETGNQKFLLERNFYHKEKRTRLVNVRDGEELSVEYGDLDMLLGNVSAVAYENTCCIGQEQLLPGQELGRLLEDERSNLAQTGSGAFQLSEALQELEQKRKNKEKQRRGLEEQRMSQIRQLEVKQQVLEQDISDLKKKQENQGSQDVNIQERTRQIAQVMEPIVKKYQTVCQEEHKLQEAVVKAQAECEKLEQKRSWHEQPESDWLEKERINVEEEQQKSGKNTGFSPLLLLGVAGLLLAPVLRVSIDGFQKAAPILNVICIVLVFAGLISAYGKHKNQKGRYERGNTKTTGKSMHSQNDRQRDFEEMEARLVELEQKKSALDQQLCQIQKQKSASEDQLKKLKEEKKALQLQAAHQEGSVEQLQSQIQEKEVELENLSEQTAELCLETSEEQEVRSDCVALELAAKTMSHLASGMSKNLEHTLDKEMSEILSQITGGGHRQLYVTDGREIIMQDQMQKRALEAYSQGTMQQAYFSYRMAAGKLLAHEEPLPFLLDETFASYDELRLRQTLRWLAEQENQIFLFTCRSTEIRLMQEEGIQFQEINV